MVQLRSTSPLRSSFMIRSSKLVSSRMIQEKMDEQAQIYCEMSILIDRAMELAAARLECKSDLGAELSIMQVVKYTVKKQQSAQIFAALKELDERIQQKTGEAPTQSQVDAIFAVPEPTFGKEEKQRLLSEARKSLRAVAG